MKAKKHFGQHFLTNKDTAQRIVDALGSLADKKVLEIGPGMGVITALMYQHAEQFKAVEIDREAIDYLNGHYPDLDIISADFLKIDLEDCYAEPFHIIGNFPYNISSQIVFKILERPNLVESWVGMFQLEMGNRLIAQPHSKQYGILSVLLPFYYTLEKVMILAPGAFNPPPKVKSIVLRAKKSTHEMKCDKAMLYRVVKTAFNQRRKVLSNSLSSIISKEVLNTSHFANLRPENLSYLQFEELCLFIEEKVSG